MRVKGIVFTGKTIPLHPLSKGKVLEWLKRHAWKACKRQKRFRGSNPRLSATVDVKVVEKKHNKII